MNKKYTTTEEHGGTNFSLAQIDGIDTKTLKKDLDTETSGRDNYPDKRRKPNQNVTIKTSANPITMDTIQHQPFNEMIKE